MRKISARWVPHQLSVDHQKARLDICSSMLGQYQRGGRRFLGKIFTSDETWVHYYDPETKQQSKQWCRKDEPSPKKFKREKTVKKVMCIVFWDSQGLILCHMVPEGNTVTKEYYSYVLESLVQPVLRGRCFGSSPRALYFLHDNASSHTAAQTKAMIQHLGWNLLAHPAYSPDLAPSDFFLFPALKLHLKGRTFSSRSQIGSVIHHWFSSKPREWFTEGINKLPERWRRCVERNGGFIEKWLTNCDK